MSKANDEDEEKEDADEDEDDKKELPKKPSKIIEIRVKSFESQSQISRS